MSKIKNLLMVFVLLLCVVPMFVACGEDDSPIINIDDRVYVSRVYFENESQVIPLTLGGPSYTLQYSFKPITAQNKTVKFTSSNPQVATVDKYGVVTAKGVGSCVITITSMDNAEAINDTARVNVVNEKEKLTTPSWSYDGTKIVWNRVVAQSSTTYQPKYEIVLTNLDDNTITTDVVSNNQYDNISFGRYKFKMRALGDSNEVLYSHSDWTNEDAGFTKLGIPTNLKVSAISSEDDNVMAERTYELSFKLADNANNIEDYEYSIIPTSGSSDNNQISDEQANLWNNAILNAQIDLETRVAKIKIPAGITNNPVRIYFGTKTSKADNIYGTSASSQQASVCVGKLDVPTGLSVSSQNGTDKTLYWTSVSNADRYKLVAKYYLTGDKTTETPTVISTTFNALGVSSYNLNKLENVPSSYKSYEIYLYAMGVDEGATVMLDSASSSCARMQLDVVSEIQIDSESDGSIYRLKWTAVPNAVRYKIYISQNQNNSLDDNDRKYSYNTSGNETEYVLSADARKSDSSPESIWYVGDNYIKVQAIADVNSNFDNSRVAVSGQRLIKLATPELTASMGKLVWKPVNNAGSYILEYGSKQQTFSTDESKAQYVVSPTLDDFNQEYSCQIKITAIGPSNEPFVIRSQASEATTFYRYKTIAKDSISILNGKLSWRGQNNTIIATDDSIINASSVEIEIYKTSDEAKILKTITSSNGSGTLDIAQELKDLDGDGFYSFKLRAISEQVSGLNYVNGDWSDAIKTYQMDAPSNLCVSNGVLSWDSVKDTNIGLYNSGIRYIIKVGDSERTDLTLGIESTSAILANLSSNQAYKISIQTKITEVDGAQYTVTGTTDTYLINSLFSNAISVKVAPKPTGLRIQDNILSWNSVGSDITTYKVSLYEKNKTDVLMSDDNIKPGSNTPSYAFSMLERNAGNYLFEVQALGNSTNILNSYTSNQIEICKLATPTITITDDGKLYWTSSIYTLGSDTRIINKYYLEIKDSDGRKIVDRELTTNSTDLSFLEDAYCSKDIPLTISIRAKSNNIAKVYDSDTATYTRNLASDSYQDDNNVQVSVYKLPKIDLSNIEISDSKIRWTSGTDYAKAGLQYYITVYERNQGNYQLKLENTLRTSGNDGYAEYSIPTTWSGLEYYVNIQQIGYMEQDSITLAKSRYLTSEFSDAKYFLRLPEATAICLSSSGSNEPILNWKCMSEQDYQRYCITLQKLNSQGATMSQYVLTYYVDYDANSDYSYSLNLFTTKGLTPNKELATLKELFGDDYYGEYEIYVKVVPALKDDGSEEQMTETTINGRTYLLTPSRTSKKQSMTIYSAPTISVSESNVVVTNSNSSSKGVELTFVEVELNSDNKDYTLKENGHQISTILGANINEYTITESILKPDTLYQVTTQAIGNKSNLVSSPKVVSNMLVSKIPTLEPNTYLQDTADETNFNGWYVKNGEVCWNSVTGATGYKIYMTYGNTTKKVWEHIDQDKNTAGLTNMGFASNFGTFGLSTQVVGGKVINIEPLEGGASSIAIGYLSSDLSEKITVNKLYAPNDTCGNTIWNNTIYNADGTINTATTVVGEDRTKAYARIDDDGEFDFGIRDENGEWTGYSGATKYRLDISGYKYSQESFKIEFDLSTEEGRKQQLIASEVLAQDSSSRSYTIAMTAIGNDWSGDMEKPIYISSDAPKTFELRYMGVIDDLGIYQGKIEWRQNSSDIKNYILRYVLDSTADEVYLQDNVFDFEGDKYQSLKGETIKEIYVRHQGMATSSTAGSGYVNTAWCINPLTNVIKIPDLGTTTVGGSEASLYINNSTGYLTWNIGSVLTGLQADTESEFTFSITREVTCDNKSVFVDSPTDVVTLSKGEYDVPRVISTNTNMTYVYDITAYVRGSGIDSKILATSGNDSVKFINGSEYNFRAGKLNTPGTFALDSVNGSVRINWDLEGCGISVETGNIIEIIQADTIMFMYYLDPTKSTLQKKTITAQDYQKIEIVDNKIIETKGEMAFWEQGTYYDLQMVVLNSEGKAFGSGIIKLNSSMVEFKHFAGGNGTREYPFQIETAEQLSYLFWLPEKYFVLNNDIVLDNLTEVQKLYPSATTNLLYPEEFYEKDSGISDQYSKKNFYGGFDGNGYVIRNYQVVGATNMSIWDTLTGVDLTDKIDNDPYQNTSGIITNLTVEVNTLDVSQLGYQTYNGIIVTQNKGLIYNCHITGDNNKTESNDETITVLPVITNKIECINENMEIFIGGIAGIVNDYKLNTYTANLESENRVVCWEQKYQGRIENCSNLLDLTIYNNEKNYKIYVGGIVGKVSNGRVVNCVNGSVSVVAGQGKNSGAINGYYAGGIAGASIGEAYNEVTSTKVDGTVEYDMINHYSYIYGCTNFAKVNTQYLLSAVGDEAVSTSVAGGIVGVMSNAYTTFCINYGVVSTDGGAAASMGGICGHGLAGTYIANVMNAGTIEYDEKYVYPTSTSNTTTTIVRAGTLCGYKVVQVLYNSVSRPDAIICKKSDGSSETIKNPPLYYYDDSAGLPTTGNIITANADLSEIALEILESKCNINKHEFTITANGAIITTGYTNILGKRPIFSFDNELNIWTIDWTGSSNN